MPSVLLRHLSVLLLTCTALTGAHAAPKADEKPPAQVVVEPVTHADFAYNLEFPARVTGSREVEVRAQVSGILQARTYAEGQAVKQGQVLFKLDSRTYEAALARAKAALAQEQARFRQAERNLARIQQMQRKGYASSSELDNALSAFEQSRANIEAANAEVLSRQIDVDFTTVKAPISGITRQEARSEGSLVLAGDPNASLLTHITQLDPVYVNFAYPDQVLEKLRLDAAQGLLEMPADGALEVQLIHSDGKPHGSKGRVDFTDSLISRGTGTVTARAVLPNADLKLVPGQFVRVQVHGLVYAKTLSVPERAVSQNAQGPVVYVVDEQGIARARVVQTGITTGGRWLIHDGLKAGEQVVVEGVKHVLPDAPVVVVTPDARSMADVGGAE